MLHEIVYCLYARNKEYSMRKRVYEPINPELFKLPFNAFYSSRYCRGGKFINPLVEEKDEITNKKVSKEQIVLYLDEFRRAYELVRPSKLGRSHPLWGTVKIMDNLFYTFRRIFLFDAYLPDFSNYPNGKDSNAYLDFQNFDWDNPGKTKEVLNWDYVYRDIKHVTERINLTLGTLALYYPEYFILTESTYSFKRWVAYVLNHEEASRVKGEVSEDDITLESIIADGEEHPISEARLLINFCA
jgi:hypothetical protein